MWSAHKQELCSVAGVTNAYPKQVLDPSIYILL
jgi:hypothetical protein